MKGGEASLVVGIASAQVLFTLSHFLVVHTILLDLFIYLLIIIIIFKIIY